MRTPPPARKKNARGRIRSIVTLTDYATHQRKTFTLGDWNTPAARQAYSRLIAEWEARGRRLTVPESLTVVEVAAEYKAWAEGYYSKGEVASIRLALLVLAELYGRTDVGTFGVGELRVVRDEMIRRGWSRKYINLQCQRIRSAFKWAAGRGMAPASVYANLATMEPLKRGRTTAPDPPAVEPVDDARVDAIEPFVSRQVWAIVQLQRLTGARGGEIMALRRGDIVGVGDRKAKVWTAVIRHKMERFGRRRTLYFGPKAQAVLGPFLVRPSESYVFVPAEARRCVTGGRRPGKRYTNTGYAAAISRACAKAWPAPDDCADVKAWNDAHRWHPHQLRHTSATEFRQRYGLEAAQVLLGHASAAVTDAVYAERDQATAMRVAREIG